MKIKVKEIILNEVDPASSGLLAKSRAKDINTQINDFENFFDFKVGDIFDVEIRNGGHAKIANLGIYSCPSKGAPPLRAGLMIDKEGNIYVDVNYHTTQ